MNEAITRRDGRGGDTRRAPRHHWEPHRERLRTLTRRRLDGPDARGSLGADGTKPPSTLLRHGCRGLASLHTTRVSLLLRIRGTPGDPGVWGEFVGLYGPAVVHWCRRHGLQDSDAHDVAQEVLVRFWRLAGRFRYDPAQRFRSYLRRMVLSAVSDWSETRRADRDATGDDTLQRVLDLAPAREDLAARIEAAFDTELLDIAMEAVEERVKPRTWEAFRLLAIERLPGCEVAERLQMDVNHAYVARFQVQRMIRDTVASLETPDVTRQTQPKGIDQ